MPPAFQSFIFALLVVQNVTVVLLMRHTRSDAAQSAYLPSVAVLTIECTKMLICTAKVGLFGGARGGSGRGAAGNQAAAAVSAAAQQQQQGESLSSLLNVRQFGASAVPALLYLVQNNLIFFAMGRVDAPTFQVLYQSKVVLTAVLSVLLLGRRLRTRQWLALALLTAGIVAVQRANEHGGGKAKGGGGGGGGGVAGAGAAAHGGVTAAVVAGSLACLAGAACSSLAGVYFEKILKNQALSMWARNWQLSCVSVVLGFGGLVASPDWARVRADGPFVGFTGLTLLVVLLQACGGLIVSSVIKYLDAIAKNFASAASMMCVALLSVLTMGTPVSAGFVGGLGAVIVACFMYSYTPPVAEKAAVLPTTADAEAARLLSDGK